MVTSAWTVAERLFLGRLIKGDSPEVAARKSRVDADRMLALPETWNWLTNHSARLSPIQRLKLFAPQATMTLARAASGDPKIRPIHVAAAKDLLDRIGQGAAIQRDRRPNAGADFGEVLGVLTRRGARGARPPSQTAPQTADPPQTTDHQEEQQQEGSEE